MICSYREVVEHSQCLERQFATFQNSTKSRNFNPHEYVIDRSCALVAVFEHARRVSPAETWLTVYRRHRVPGLCAASWTTRRKRTNS